MGPVVNIEGKSSPLYNLVLDKYFDKGSYTTCNLSFYFHPKKQDAQYSSTSIADTCDFASLTKKFTPMAYSFTSSYTLEMVFRILNDNGVSTKYIHKNINLREVINLKAASDLSSKVTSVSETKITYGEICKLAMFLVDRVKHEGIFEDDQEPEHNSST